MQTDGLHHVLDGNLHAPVMSQRSLNPLLTPYATPSAHLAHLQLAAALDEQRAARTRAEAAQLLQMMEMSRQHRQVPPPDDGTLPPGMTFKLAVAGMQVSEAPSPESNRAGGSGPVGRSPDSVQGTQSMPSSSSRTEHCKPAAKGSNSAPKKASSVHSGSDAWQHEAAAKKCGSRQTLRTYLQKLRSEDPRCIFIVRRINKLGFRSKVLLEKHYSQFGEVAQVCVAHSKVKPLPNTQGANPRTRPGNFGLVVMRHPGSVRRVLQQGTPQNVMGFEILVYRFEQHEVEKEVMNQEEEEGEGAYEPDRRNFQTGQEDWNRQDSSSSNGSNGSGQANAAKHAMDWVRFRDEQAAQVAAEQALRAQSTAHVQAAPQAMPGLPADTILGRLSLQEIQELQQLGQVSRGLTVVPESSAAAAPGSLLPMPCGDGLQAMVKDLYTYIGESALQAVHLAQLQEHVGRLHGECQQKMAELSAVARAAAMTQMPAAPGLVPAAAPSVDNSGLTVPARSLAAPVAPWLHGAPSIPPVPVPPVPPVPQALTVLQAQQLVNNMQAQLTAGRGSGLPPPAGPVSWPPSSLLAAAAPGPGAPSVPPGVCHAPAAAPTNQAFCSATPNNWSEPSKAQSYEEESTHERGSSEDSIDKQRGQSMKSFFDDCSTDGATDTLRNYLIALKDEAPSRIFIARRLNKLGFKSSEIIQQHFALYGKVKTVLVPHSKVKPWLSNDRQTARVRPGSLGIIVMEDSKSVKQILALGEEQIIAGHTLIVQRFSQPLRDKDQTHTQKQQEQHYESSTGTGTSQAKSEESSGSAPDACEKSDGDGSNSGQEVSNSSSQDSGSPGLH